MGHGRPTHSDEEQERKRTQATKSSVRQSIADAPQRALGAFDSSGHRVEFVSVLGSHAHGAPDVRDCRTDETAATCKRNSPCHVTKVRSFGSQDIGAQKAVLFFWPTDSAAVAKLSLVNDVFVVRLLDETVR